MNECGPDCWNFCCLAARGRDAAPAATQPTPTAPAGAGEAAAPSMRASTRRDGDRQYVGVLRVGRRVVAECGHVHTNRDETSKTGGRSARDCAERIMRAAHEPFYADEVIAGQRDAWQHHRDGFWQYTAADIERRKATCAKDADELAALIVRVRDMLDPATIVWQPRVLTLPGVL